MTNQAFGMGEIQIFSELESKGMRQGKLKKQRHGVHKSLLLPNINREVSLKTEEDSDRVEFEEITSSVMIGKKALVCCIMPWFIQILVETFGHTS